MYATIEAHNMQKTRGFTLIELLFLIAIAGALSVSGILFYQQQMHNQKIEKTVAQIDQWLQAAVAYRAQNNKWPANLSDLTAPAKPYMPAEAAAQNPYCDSKSNNGQPCFNRFPPRGSPGGPQLFNLGVVLLTDEGTTNQIKSRLPHAINLDNRRIMAMINMPPPPGKLQHQDAIVARIEKRTVKGAEAFKFIEPPKGRESERYAMATILIPPVEQPDCSQYGAAYQLVVYPLQPNGYFIRKLWRGGLFGGDPQQPVLSLLSFRSVGFDSNRNYELRVCARPQWFFQSVIGSHMESNSPNTLQETAEAQLQLFFVCKKTSTVTPSQDTCGLPPASSSLHAPEFRF
jgi:type II secretory pathway pseudopilin PulG